MHKVNRFDITEKKIERFIKEGRGRGTLADYKPWLTIGDLSSMGLSSRVWWHHTLRIHHLFSDLERSCFWIKQRESGVTDIREQFPLERSITRQIAKDLGYEHPKYKGVEPYMTTDLLIDFSGKKSRKAVYVKYKDDLDDERTFEKLCIEIEYWERKEIELEIFTEEQATSVILDNIRWLSVVEPVLSPMDDLKMRAKFYGQQMMLHPNVPLTTFAQEIDRRYGYDSKEIGKSLFEIKELIAISLFKFDFNLNFRTLICSDIHPTVVNVEYAA